MSGPGHDLLPYPAPAASGIVEMEVDVMATHTQHLHHAPGRAATAVLVLGIIAALSGVLTGLLSFTDTLDPPGWVRVAMTTGLPIGILGAPSVWFLAPAARREPMTIVGMGLVVVTLAAFIVMVNVAY